MNKRPCHFFAKGSCRKGTSCEYAHDQQPSQGASMKTGTHHQPILLNNLR